MTLLGRALGAWRKAANQVRPPAVIGAGIIPGGVMGDALGGGRLAQMSAYGSVGWLFAAVNRISSAVAASEWRLYRRQPGGDRREVFDHPMLSLWNRMNPFTTRGEFLETTQQYLDLTGESWWVLLRNRAGALVEVWPVRPDRMRTVPHPQEYVAGYVYTLGTQQVPLERDDVVFIRMPNPLDPYRGMGPVQSILPDLESELMSAQWTRNFFRNSAAPGGIIEFDQSLSDEEFERLTMRWREQHQGVANAHRVAILERGTWKDRRLTQRDMQFEQIRKLNRDTILGAFGLPIAVMGITETVNRANAEAGEVMFSRWVVRPRLQRIKEAVNARLAPLFGEDLEMDYDDPTLGNRELNLEEAVRGYEAGILTQAEARARLGEGEPGTDPSFPAPSEFSVLGSPRRRTLAQPGGEAVAEGLVGTNAGAPRSAEQTSAPPHVAQAKAAGAEVRCPQCRKLLARSVSGTAELWCPRCKRAVGV